ncbi:MAG: UDP-2,3-diacylglucosamine diphosphatase LpxI [Deltaproteobacteria bacterium]|nr:UDP-2,3-diacylglucosamine diphosphatase LpxI [Deltaproteobacteria bacterium]
MTADTVGLVAGSGAYPVLLSRRLLQQGINVVVAGVSGHAVPADFPGCQFRIFPVGQIQAASRWFRDMTALRAVLAGGIKLRFGQTAIAPDRSLLLWLPLLFFGGDDKRLRYIAGAFERCGVRIISPRAWIDDWFPGAGHLAGPSLNRTTAQLLARGVARCRAFVQADVGQSVVVHGTQWTGRENRRGTDKLLKTVPGPGAVLVKMKKQTQDVRFDIPAIGPGTVETAAQMGVRLVAVEAGEVMVISQEKTFQLCRDLNVSLMAF